MAFPYNLATLYLSWRIRRANVRFKRTPNLNEKHFNEQINRLYFVTKEVNMITCVEMNTFCFIESDKILQRFASSTWFIQLLHPSFAADKILCV